MSLSEQQQNAVEAPFTLTVDQYGRLWLHAKIEGVPVMIDLAEKSVAFEIMATSMFENDYEHCAVPEHEAADNDDGKPTGVGD